MKKYEELRKIKGRITELGESYRSVSEKSGMSVHSLSNKLNGESVFNLNEVRSLCKILDIGPEDIANFFAIDVAK